MRQASAAVVSALLLIVVHPVWAQSSLLERRFTQYDRERPVSEASKEPRTVAIVSGLPIISTSVKDNKREVTIYVTPSCPTCFILIYDLMEKGLLMSEALKHTNVSFVFVPRVDDDHKLIKNIFCVDERKRLTAVSQYFKSAIRVTAAIPSFDGIDARLAMRTLGTLSADVARSMGTSEQTLDACQSDRLFDQSITLAWQHGWRRNAEKDWPLIVIDQQPTKIKTSFSLINALKE